MRALFNFLRKVLKYRYTIRSFAVRDIRRRYSGSFIGLFWSVLHPLVMVLTYSVIFSLVFRARVGEQYGGAGYPMWLLCGLIPWFFFSESLRRSSTVIIENESVVTKTIFPSEILPIGLLISTVISHLIGVAIILVGLLITTGGIPLTALWLPAYFVPFFIMALGFSWLLASVNVFIRDVGQMTSIVMQLWFYYTPIIYPIGIVPERLRPFFLLNPVYHYVEGYRGTLLMGESPDPAVIASLTAVSVGFFIAGGYAFKRLKPYFPDVL